MFHTVILAQALFPYSIHLDPFVEHKCMVLISFITKMWDSSKLDAQELPNIALYWVHQPGMARTIFN